MLRLRADGLHRMSSLFLHTQSAEIWHVSPAESMAAALALKRHKGFAAPMSPFDSVKARVRSDQEDAAAHPSGDASLERRDSQADQESTSMAASGTASVPGGASLDSGRSPSSSAASASAAADPRAQHWMDRHFPKAREWLQQKNIQWWLRGVQARCRQLPQLSGREELITKLVTEKYHGIVERHRHRVIDGRAETHLQVAALLLATYQTLSPWLRDDQELVQLLKEHMGGQASPGLRVMLRGTLLLSRSPFAWQSARLRALQLDQGAGFKSDLRRNDANASLTVNSCFYHDLLSAEGAPHLAAACCCGVDRVWFENLEWHGVAFEQPTCLARGDSCCQLRVWKI